MAEVTLTIHGRNYGVGCDDGQERRVKDLGQYIERKVKEIAASGASASEAHMLVLAALMLADELFEARESTQPLRTQLAQQAKMISDLEEQLTSPNVAAQPASGGIDDETETQIVSAIDSLAGRLEGIAKRIQQAA